MTGRTGFWFAMGLLVLCSLAFVWFLQNFDQKSYETRGTPKREAIRNPMLAAEMLLRELGYKVDTVQEAAYLEQLPSNGTLILSGSRQYHLTPGRTDALFEWVESGGYLLADAASVTASDAILKHFDVRFQPRRRVTTPAKPESAEETDDEEWDKELARRKAPREPTRRTVAIPGYGRDLRMRANEQRPLYVGRVEPSWTVAGGRDPKDKEGMELVEFELGKGKVTLINGLWRFDNGHIEQDNHAELLAALLVTHQPSGTVRIMTRLNVPSLWEWLSDHAQAALLSGLILLAAWLWHIIPRFGVLRPDAVLERRSLIEHLRAIGRFLWRKQSLDVLLEAARNNLQARIALRVATSGQPLHADLAQRSGLDAGDIAFALTGDAQTPAQITAVFKTLRELDHRLK